MNTYVNQPMFTYLGNKRKLLEGIEEVIVNVKKVLGKEKLKLMDGFTGSTVVARMLSCHASELHANDLELYSYVAAKCFLESPSPEQRARIYAHLSRMNVNAEEGWLNPGIITEMYAPQDTQNVQPGERCFFTHENALRIDTWRGYIDNYVEEDIKHWCLAPILIQMSLRANTYGHFKAFSKRDNIGSFELCGERVATRMLLETPIFNPNDCKVFCYNESTNDLLNRLPNDSLDLIYLDPPYNEHEYGAFYFLHNVVCKNEKPVNVNSVTGLPRERRKSLYNHKIECAIAMRQLLARCTAVSKYTLISYNDEGLIGHAGWNAILEPYHIQFFERPYTRYSANTKKEKEGPKEVRELLYLIRRVDPNWEEGPSQQ
jgi:adenine-specific DNA-methyltransferase